MQYDGFCGPELNYQYKLNEVNKTVASLYKLPNFTKIVLLISKNLLHVDFITLVGIFICLN